MQLIEQLDEKINLQVALKKLHKMGPRIKWQPILAIHFYAKKGKELL